jgi:hypothetical protein
MVDAGSWQPPALAPARTFVAREIEQAYPMALLTATLKAPERQGELDFDDIDLLGRTGREAGLKWFAAGSLEGGRYEEGKESTPFGGQARHA